jgi:glycosyltransferase involved in cell wall biosynthesis
MSSNTESAKFTILVPTRERAYTLHETLKTCVAQDHDRLEIIVSDNFSRDNTREIV